MTCAVWLAPCSTSECSGRALHPPVSPEEKASAALAAHRHTANGRSCKSGRNYTVFPSADSKNIPKICPEHQGLTVTLRKDARGWKCCSVLVIWLFCTFQQGLHTIPEQQITVPATWLCQLQKSGADLAFLPCKVLHLPLCAWFLSDIVQSMPRSCLSC